MSVPPESSLWYRGWRLWQSDAGRCWATRTEPFSIAAQDADAHRTVDADDYPSLAKVIDEHELIAETVAQ